MDFMPKVSVIIPVYNVENYIEKCLNSVLNQTLKEIEIIIVNDGSKDSSKQKIEKYLEKHENKIIYLEKENGGLSDARNYGIGYAKGEYIAFLDSDDYIEPTMYEEMYKKAKEENSDMVECDFLWEYPKKVKEDVGIIYNNKKEMLAKARVVAWNKLIKRQILLDTKIEFPKGLRYEDVEFFYKLIPYLGKISFLKKCFVHYVQRENSIANTQNSRTKEIFTVLDNVIKFYKEKGFFEEYKCELEYNYARLLLCSSLKRMCKIQDRKERNEALKETWNKLNTEFPNWKQNEILQEKGLKNLYMKSLNNVTYKLFCFCQSFQNLCTLENLMCLFVILCPILDCLSFLYRNCFNTSISPTTILRPIIPIIVFTILFFKENNKLKKIAVASIYALYSIVHLFIFQKLNNGSSYGTIKNEIQYLINYSFMIINLYLFYRVVQDKKKLKKSVFISFVIYVLLIFISIITKTSSSTYIEKIGYKGYFESGNSLCTVLILSIAIILSEFTKKKWKEAIFVVLAGVYLTIFSGMRTGLFGFGLIVLIFAFIKILELLKTKLSKVKIILGVILILAFGILISIFGAKTLERRKMLKEQEASNIDNETGEKRYVTGDILELYKKILKQEVDETYMSKPEQNAIVDLCEYAKKIKLSTVNLRKQQLIYNVYLVKEQKNIGLILFGNGYKNQTGELVMEMEIPAFLINFGVFGFILYFGPFLAILIYALKKSFKKINLENAMYLTGIGLAMGLATLSGYVYFSFSSMTMVIILNVLLLKNIEKEQVVKKVG